jgi:glyoxylase-like metal-dependent hydrolase (beta-lactamase superfamily II)
MSGSIVRSALLLAALCVSTPGHGQEDGEALSVTATHVAGCVWRLEGRGGNIGVCAGGDGIFMVDDQYAPLTPAILEAVGRIQPGPVRFVLNTHWHFDHTGGNENLGRRGTLIVAHDNVRERMSTDQFMAFLDREVQASPPGALPVVTFGGDITFHVNDETIHAFHVPRAHTDGDAIVHFREADVVHMGDVVWSGQYPFIDTGSGGSVAGVLAAVEAVLPLVGEATAVIAGHGPITDRAGLLAYRDMLAGVSAEIARLMAEGRTLGEIREAAPSAAYDEAWGAGFIKPERFVEMIYLDLKNGADPSAR